MNSMAKAGIGNVTKSFGKSYAENLPQDLLERLKRSGRHCHRYFIEII